MTYDIAQPVSTDVGGCYGPSDKSDYMDYSARVEYFVEQTKEQSEFEETFRRLVNEWLNDVIDISSTSQMINHPAYLQIIGMGIRVLPHLIRELERAPNHWFAALTAITREDPILPDQQGNLSQMTAAWLEWADKEGYA